MSEMVERVARAIEDEFDRGAISPYEMLGFDTAKQLARVAITVMREPTQAMEDVLTGTVYGYGEAVTAYSYAIDKALEP